MIDWKLVMDAAFATLIASLISIAGMLTVNWFSNRKGYKDIDAKIGKVDNKTLVELIEQKVGNLPNTTLSGQHEMLEKNIIRELEEKQNYLNNKIGNLEDTTISGQNKHILLEVQSLKDAITRDRNNEYLKKQQLTGDQARIEQSITILSSFSQIMVDLQNANTKLENENKLLHKENQELKQQLELFESNIFEEPSENQSLEMD